MRLLVGGNNQDVVYMTKRTVQALRKVQNQ
jgi:hypothetical protein